MDDQQDDTPDDRAARLRREATDPWYRQERLVVLLLVLVTLAALFAARLTLGPPQTGATRVPVTTTTTTTVEADDGPTFDLPDQELANHLDAYDSGWAPTGRGDEYVWCLVVVDNPNRQSSAKALSCDWGSAIHSPPPEGFVDEYP